MERDARGKYAARVLTSTSGPTRNRPRRSPNGDSSFWWRNHKKSRQSCRR